jgi:hypothetical protein
LQFQGNDNLQTYEIVTPFSNFFFGLNLKPNGQECSKYNKNCQDVNNFLQLFLLPDGQLALCFYTVVTFHENTYCHISSSTLSCSPCRIEGTIDNIIMYLRGVNRRDDFPMNIGYQQKVSAPPGKHKTYNRNLSNE